ncbi:MAG TPA: thioesterase family protein [Pyrinomonadaceae bacterium]|nr:thioesterase family protein [Pyrinomonadaceae bacterium]
MSFSTPLTVNFGDTDPAGLVYFPNIFHYCHIAMERFFQEVCGVSYSELVGDQQLGFPTARIDAEFKAPVRYGDVINVEIRVSDVGNKSLSLSYIVKNNEGIVCAEVRQVVVAMELGRQASVSIPDSIRQSLLAQRL